MKNIKREQARNLYIEGRSITDIGRALSITRQTVYSWKGRDKERGIDWEELALQRAQDVSGVKTTEKEFLLALIRGFEEALQELDDLSPKERLALFKEYSTTYYKLKAPLKSDCAALVAQARSRLIYEISELALKAGHRETVEFLSTHADEIILLSQSKQ